MNSLKLQGLDFDGLDSFDNWQETQVPKTAPISRNQYNASTKEWPCSFHEDKTIEKLIGRKWFSNEQLEAQLRFFNLCSNISFHPEDFLWNSNQNIELSERLFDSPEEIEVSTSACIGPIGVVIIDSLDNKVIAAAALNKSCYPLRHSVMAAIDLVAQTQGGGSWESKEANGSSENNYSMLSWGYYQRYFDVDTPQVKERLIWSFIPRPAKDTLTNFIRPSPDLYGPFWVCVTLIFCIAIMGNVADYLNSGGEGQHWRYDFRKVSISATSIFCYALLLPLLLWVFLWWRKSKGDQLTIGIIEIICLYGYSLAIYIPISVLWTIPFPFIQWTLVIVGATLSGSVLVLALWGPLSSIPKGLVLSLLAAVLFCHFLLAAGLQLYFFRYSQEVIIQPAVVTSTLNPTLKVEHFETTLKALSLIREDHSTVEQNFNSTTTSAPTETPKMLQPISQAFVVAMKSG
uniref:EOG090X0CJ3 n=1 Tax=Evadne anonyx TaxID=141404 RepID=A0A9N6WXR3_9CRUS|nr:EOG090X0CJ3 [Evadne anonyx]